MPHRRMDTTEHSTTAPGHSPRHFFRRVPQPHPAVAPHTDDATAPAHAIPHVVQCGGYSGRRPGHTGVRSQAYEQDLGRKRHARDTLAVTSRGHGPDRIVGVRATAYDWAITHSTSFFAVIPPVEVAAATEPCLSMQTHPTVSWPMPPPLLLPELSADLLNNSVTAWP